MDKFRDFVFGLYEGTQVPLETPMLEAAEGPELNSPKRSLKLELRLQQDMIAQIRLIKHHQVTGHVDYLVMQSSWDHI